MANKYCAKSMNMVFAECQEMFQTNTPTFFELLETHVDLYEFIPTRFHLAFHRHLGRNRDYPLEGFLTALIVQKILSIPTDSLLIVLLKLCKEFREYCGFTKAPDAPMFTRFKQNFLPYIQEMFERMIDYTEPICQAIDSALAKMIAFDTTGIELYVKENNPKMLNSLIKRLKSFYKDKPEVDPYKMAYGLMPSQAEHCGDAKQQYINGHFCYADKLAILTNGLGIVRHISFLDDAFKYDHPEMPAVKKSDSPDEDKSVGDSTSLKPVLSDFFTSHPDFRPDTFLGDAAFDTIETYGFLKNEFHFSRALIPYNQRNESDLEKAGYNLYGYPTCPNDSDLDMKYLGHCHEAGRSDRVKWGCPKMRSVKGNWLCDCAEPCSTAKQGRTTYTYENMDFRMFPGLQRDSAEWISLYKVRTNVERAINHFKTNMCVAGRKSRDHLTTKADVFLAGIASQFTAIVAHRIACPQFLLSLKSLVA